MEDLTPVVQLGAAGVLLMVALLLIRMIARGDWVPRRELDYVRADRDARIAEKDQEAADWRAAHETSEKARELQTEQVRQLIDGFRTIDHFFESLRSLAEKSRDVG